MGSCDDGLIVGAVLRLLTDGDAEVRSAALQSLARVAARGQAEVLRAVEGLLADADSSVRGDAARALGSLAERGDSTVVAFLCLRLDRDGEPEDDEEARSELLDALAAVAPRGHCVCLGLAVACLSDESEGVRSSAVKVLEALVEPVNSEVLTSLQPLLASTEAFTRCAALGALAVVGAGGGADVAADCSRCFSDEDEGVRTAAVKAIVGVASRGHEASLAGVLELLKDEDEDVRCAAAEAAGRLACEGDSKSMAALRKVLGDDDRDVRCAVIGSLASTVARADTDLVEALASCFQDEEETVRDAAVDAIARVAQRTGCEPCLSVVVAQLQHEGADVRCCAAKAIANLARLDDFVVVKDSVTSLLEDNDASVREAAGDAIAAMAQCSTANAGLVSELFEAMKKRCSHGDPAVRCSTLDAIRKISNDVGARAVEPVCKALEDKQEIVQDAAKQTLAGLPWADEGMAAALFDGCVARLESRSRAQQRAAAAAVAAAQPRGSASAVTSALLRLRHTIPQVRRASVEFLAAAAAPFGATLHESRGSRASGPSDGHIRDAEACWSQALEATAMRLEDDEEKVRSAAVAALGLLVSGEDASASNDCYRFDEVEPSGPGLRLRALSAVEPRLRHDMAAIRSSAAEAVASVALRGDEAAEAMLIAMLVPGGREEEDADVRWSALRALSVVAAVGSQAAIAAALLCASGDADEQVRLAAFEVLGGLANKGDKHVIAIVEACFNKSSETAAFEALMRLLPDPTSRRAEVGFAAPPPCSPTPGGG